MPLIVGALMRRFGAGEDAATGFAALEIAGIAISCAIFPRWIARAPRRLAWIATLGTLLAQAASACDAQPRGRGRRAAGHGPVRGRAVRRRRGQPVQPRRGRARVGRDHPRLGRHRLRAAGRRPTRCPTASSAAGCSSSSPRRSRWSPGLPAAAGADAAQPTAALAAPRRQHALERADSALGRDDPGLQRAVRAMGAGRRRRPPARPRAASASARCWRSFRCSAPSARSPLRTAAATNCACRSCGRRS